MSGKHCGPSKGLLDLDAKIGSALDDIQNSSIGTGAAGIADSISGLKDNLKSKTDGILEKIEAAVPEIPEPKANLQEQMTKLMTSLDNPGVALQELKNIKGEFGDKINVDEMLSKTGVDPSKLESLSKEFESLQNQAKAKNVIGSLGKLASGDLSAIKGLMGGLPQITLPGFDVGSIVDGICKDVPNVEIDADGNFVKKGVETKVATEDAEPIEEAAEVNNASAPEKVTAPADNLETSKNVILNPDTDKAQEIEKEFVDNMALIQEDIDKFVAPFIKGFIAKVNEISEYEKTAPFITVGPKWNRFMEGLRQLHREKIALQRRGDAETIYVQLRQKTFEYQRDIQLFEAKLIDEEPTIPTITSEEIHSLTHFQFHTEAVERIYALQPKGIDVNEPPIYIRGRRPQRLNREP